MKKYFLLFTTSFIAFGACLITASSSSYGMNEESEESKRDVVSARVGLTRAIEDFQKIHGIHGTMAVGKSGRIVYTATDGNRGPETSCTEDTQYPIGSLTKQFTAVALLHTVLDISCKGNANDLQKHLNKPIIHFLKKDDEIWGEKQAPNWASKVTLHHLLSQTSGLKDVSIPEYLDFGKASRTRAEVVDLYCKNNEDLSFEPGSRYEYSNPNFFFAGVVVERLVNQTLGEYLQAKFFTPLDMEGTFLPDVGTVEELVTTGKYPKLALGYMYSFKDKSEPLSPVTEYFPSDLNQGDGGVISTVGDLTKWNHALYETESILPEAAKKLMLTPMALPGEEQSTYGYGIDVINDGDERIIYTHKGLVPGYRSIICYDPAHKLTLVQLSNLSQDLSQFIDIMDRQGAIKSSPPSEEKEKKIKSLAEEYPVAETQYEQYRLIGWPDIAEALK